MVLTLFFNSVYPDGAIDRYYIGPALIAWTWLAILGRTAVDLAVAPGGLLGQGSAIATRWLRPAVAAAIGVVLLLPSITGFSTRATIVDDTRDVAARTWTDAVLGTLEPDAVIVSWWSYSTPLWYAQVVDDRRPDVCIIDDRNRLDYALGELDQVIARYLSTRPVYLVRNGDSELPALVGKYNVTPVGLPAAPNLLRVTAIGSADGPGTPVVALSPRAADWRSAAAELDTPALRPDCP